jgi:hypothetical protein
LCFQASSNFLSFFFSPVFGVGLCVGSLLISMIRHFCILIETL